MTATKVATAVHLNYRLVVFFPNGESIVHPLVKSFVKVGRTKANDIVIPYKQMSEYHFNLTRTDKGYDLCDGESTTGTFVNYRPVWTGQTRPLVPGDTITQGMLKIRFEATEANA